MRRSFSALALAFVVIAAAPAAQDVTIGTRPGSLKFAVLGDAGTGERPQYEVGDRMWSARSAFAFDFVLLTGDNMYGRQLPEDFVTKFQKPYERLLGAGVRFYAALGNHDKPENRFYAPFNMNGERYYSFSPRADVRFVVLDTNLLDPKQLEWARETLVAAREPWKIAVFHHPIYSDGGRHGSNIELRVALEPLLVASGVEVVFTGHDHFYERIKPQKTVTHFVLGSGGQLRRGDVKRSALTAAAFDQDQSFMLVELAGDQLFFQTISRTGVTVDAGVIDRRPTT
jgi:calcineurin-like phosphoesterase family protein